MALDSYQLPIELWEEIISHAFDRGLFPYLTATFFEKMDLFASPCKIYQIVRDRASLRLVCRLWDEIVRRKQKPVVFLDPDHEKDQICSGSSRRTEITSHWGEYCRRWPCAPLRDDDVSRDGSCSSASFCWLSFTDAEYEAQSQSLSNVQVLRIQAIVEDLTPLLEKCINLEALWIPFHGDLTPSLERATPVLCKMQYLSHLYLSAVASFGQTLKLHLPRVIYLGIKFWLYPNHPLPLDLEVPNIKTIEISGRITQNHTSSLMRLINSCRESVVEIVLRYDHPNCQSPFPLDQLCGFPRLNTLGLSVDRTLLSTAAISPITPRPTSAPLSLVLFGLEKRTEQSKLDECKEKLSTLFTDGERPGFSKLIVGSEWRQLSDNSYTDRGAKRGDNRETERALSSYWPMLEYLDQKGIPIEDRNGVRYSKEMG